MPLLVMGGLAMRQFLGYAIAKLEHLVDRLGGVFYYDELHHWW